MKTEHDYYQISLRVIMKNNQGEILALKCPTTGSFAGFYDFPGGRINKQEFKTPLINILKREIKEEIGNIKYKLSNQPVAVGRHLLQSKFSGLKKDQHVLYLFFEAKYIQGEIKISPEHTGYQWINMKNHKPEKLFKSGNLEGIKMYLN